MGQYTTKGLLNGYKKNNKERAELDYYATPTAEVENILNQLHYDFTDKLILEPCIGGGHMMDGILNYCNKECQLPKIYIGTDYLNRNYKNKDCDISYGLDFLDDDYPVTEADVIIMNPPYATIEPFLIRALEIAKEKLIVLCRTQVIEGASRYNKIFSKDPPNYMYQYIDRIQCWKNGVEPSGSSAQAYCWLIWDRKVPVADGPVIKWIHRA